jgi:hypothetical protein
MSGIFFALGVLAEAWAGVEAYGRLVLPREQEVLVAVVPRGEEGRPTGRGSSAVYVCIVHARKRAVILVWLVDSRVVNRRRPMIADGCHSLAAMEVNGRVGEASSRRIKRRYNGTNGPRPWPHRGSSIGGAVGC